MIRVLLADDDPLVLSGLTMMLRGAEGIEVVGEVADGADVADAVRHHAPDVVLMDIRMPVVDGIAATRALARRDTAPQVIILTTFGADDTVLAAIRAGAAGYLLKHTKPEQIVDAVRRAGRGADSRAEQARARLAVLSERERQIAAAVAEGLSNTEIGGRLHVSAGTVKAGVSSALSKLGLDSRIQLALLAHDADRR